MERGKNYEYCATDASANRWSAIDQQSANCRQLSATIDKHGVALRVNRTSFSFSVFRSLLTDISLIILFFRTSLLETLSFRILLSGMLWVFNLNSDLFLGVQQVVSFAVVRYFIEVIWDLFGKLASLSQPIRLTIDPWEWLASNFSLQYHPWITRQCHENKGNDHQHKKLLIVKQILLVNTLG